MITNRFTGTSKSHALIETQVEASLSAAREVLPRQEMLQDLSSLRLVQLASAYPQSASRSAPIDSVERSTSRTDRHACSATVSKRFTAATAHTIN
jgi:hypothetical protein